MRLSVCNLVVSFGLCSAVHAQSDGSALQTALTLCATLPATTQDARSTLEVAGWVESETAAMAALATIGLGARFRADDAEYSVTNAFFMAASVLGNSALGDEQVSMEVGPYRFGLLGIVEGTPYCVLSGSRELTRVFFDYFETQHSVSQSSEALQQWVGMGSDGVGFTFVHFDEPALDAYLTAFVQQQASNDPDLDMDRMWEVFSTTAVQIMTPEALQ